MVKDLRTEKETTDVEGVMNGDLDLFISVLGGDGGIQLSKNFLFYENI